MSVRSTNQKVSNVSREPPSVAELKGFLREVRVCVTAVKHPSPLAASSHANPLLCLSVRPQNPLLGGIECVPRDGSLAVCRFALPRAKHPPQSPNAGRGEHAGAAGAGFEAAGAPAAGEGGEQEAQGEGVRGGGFPPRRVLC